MASRSSMLSNLGGVVTMFLGGFLSLFVVVNLNQPVERSKDKAARAPVSFDVTPQKPKPKKRKPRPKPQRRTAVKSAAKAPNLGSSLSGLDVGLLGLGNMVSTAHGAEGSGGDVVMSEDVVDEPPTPVQRTAPKYPPSARAQGLSGYVTMSIWWMPAELFATFVFWRLAAGVFDQAAKEPYRLAL